VTALVAICNGLGQLNAAILTLGRALGAICLAVMVVAILIQVFFRYVLNDALPWPEELARFLMLWSTGLMIPTAYRRGGFVSIEMLSRLLPRRVAATLALVLSVLALIVLAKAAQLGWAEVTGFGGRSETDTLRVPVSFSFDSWMKLPKSTLMASLLVGIWLLIAVNVELILRQVVAILGWGEDLTPIADAASMGAE
jgi:TRAP-type C4-dicarboxylate transport system permease small subunit